MIPVLGSAEILSKRSARTLASKDRLDITVLPDEVSPKKEGPANKLRGLFSSHETARAHGLNLGLRATYN